MENESKTISVALASRALFVAALLTAGIAVAADPECAKARQRIDKAEKQLKDLYRQRDEMDREFQGHLEQDFAAQAESVWDQVHRNNAVKVIFVRNRMNRKIESRQKSANDSREKFCSKCGGTEGYCRLCPDTPSCVAGAPSEPEAK